MKESSPPSYGFTLLELLTVIAIIGLLAGILFPVINGARRSGLQAKSKTQFAQWKTAIESYRQEYGYYPFTQGSGDNLFKINESGNRELFEEVLNGSNRTFNRRGIPFYRLSENDLEEPARYGSNIIDAFGNTDLAILIDADLDGRIAVDGFEIKSSVEVIAHENEALGFPRITTWVESDQRN